jgi:hypothetical protein
LKKGKNNPIVLIFIPKGIIISLMKSVERLMWQSRESFEGTTPQLTKDFYTTHPELIVPVPPSQDCGIRYMRNCTQYDLHPFLKSGEIPSHSVDEIQVVFTGGQFAYQLMHPNNSAWDRWMRILKTESTINIMGLCDPFIFLSEGKILTLAQYPVLLRRLLQDRGLMYEYRESMVVGELYDDPTLGPYLRELDGNFVDWPYWNGHFHLQITKPDIEYYI